MTMLLVYSNPRIYAKLMDELISAERAGAITRPLIREAEAKKLPYLQAVIREGLRKFPPLTPMLSKTVPEGGDIVCGHHLPAGTQVGVHIVSLDLLATKSDESDAGLTCDIGRHYAKHRVLG